MLNRLKVVLCGKEYVLQTEDAPSYVYQLAKTLEKRISDITESNKRVSVHSAVMMVALSTMDELTKANNNIEVIRSQVKEYVDEAGKVRLERDAVMREVDVLRAKVEQLENQLKLRDLKVSFDEDMAAQKDEKPAENTKEQEAETSAAETDADAEESAT
ncbi:MAG: cell division protein ZapA [Oscillospiraceae bacterium]|nr:cell division protein ZapA [Oscillospiraceae bacterium]